MQSFPTEHTSPRAFADVSATWETDPSGDNLPAELNPAPHGADGAAMDHSEPPPMLPDPIALPDPVHNEPIAERSNPYRSAELPQSSVYSEQAESFDNTEDFQSEEFALPEIDDQAQPASRDEVIESAADDVDRPLETNTSVDESFSSRAPVSRYSEAAADNAGNEALSRHGRRQSGPQCRAKRALRRHRCGGGRAPRRFPPSPYGNANLQADPVYEEPATFDASQSRAVTGANEELPGTTYNSAPTTAIQANGKPGPQSMEGPQSPTLTLQKVAPEEIQVGQPAKFEIRVRNTGRVTAENVVIRDEIPAGTNFLDAVPKASRSADGAIYWDAGSIAPGQEVAVAMELMPVTEGQIGSVATVSFQASASARTRATKPQLVLEHTGPLKVLVGEAVQFSIKLSNPGTGSATQVVLEEDVPTGLAHSSGGRLEYEVGTIEPGQTRQLELTLKADQAGHVVNTIAARADGGLSVEDSVELDVVSPELQVAIEGPKRRYLDRQATFTIAVANPGTAPARNVELVAQLPTGLKFVSTNNSGYYDQSRHAVIWSLEQLPAGEMGKAQFTAMPIEMGSFQVHAEGPCRHGSGSAKRTRPDGRRHRRAILWLGRQGGSDRNRRPDDVRNQGRQSGFEGGHKCAVRRACSRRHAGRWVLKGPTQEAVEGQRVTFAPLERLAPQEQAIFPITVAGQIAGDHRFRVQMTSDETTAPVIKEESTRVYSRLIHSCRPRAASTGRVRSRLDAPRSAAICRRRSSAPRS